MSLLAERLIAIDDALAAGKFPHAFGGAIALAYCTGEPRGTRDLDVNVFAAPSRAREVFAALPDAVTITPATIEQAERDGQVRVWWDETPIDIFLDTLRLHQEVADGVRRVPFTDRTIPVLDCTSLAVFKAMFDRTRDWADIEAMVQDGNVDIGEAVSWVKAIAGAEAPEARRLAALGE
jgi:hypothetical protein